MWLKTFHAVCLSYLPQLLYYRLLCVVSCSIGFLGEFVFNSDGVCLAGCLCNMHIILTFGMNFQSSKYAGIFFF